MFELINKMLAKDLRKVVRSIDLKQRLTGSRRHRLKVSVMGRHCKIHLVLPVR